MIRFVYLETLSLQWQQYLKTSTPTKYKVKLGWCFGMEILALHFSLTSLVLYALMFTAKKRPESG